MAGAPRRLRQCCRCWRCCAADEARRNSAKSFEYIPRQDVTSRWLESGPHQVCCLFYWQKKTNNISALTWSYLHGTNLNHMFSNYQPPTPHGKRFRAPTNEPHSREHSNHRCKSANAPQLSNIADCQRAISLLLLFFFPSHTTFGSIQQQVFSKGPYRMILWRWKFPLSTVNSVSTSKIRIVESGATQRQQRLH